MHPRTDRRHRAGRAEAAPTAICAEPPVAGCHEHVTRPAGATPPSGHVVRLVSEYDGLDANRYKMAEG